MHSYDYYIDNGYHCVETVKGIKYIKNFETHYETDKNNPDKRILIEKSIIIDERTGDKYEGFLRDTKYDGYGILNCFNGKNYDGIWSNGEFIYGKVINRLTKKISIYEKKNDNVPKQQKELITYENGNKYEGYMSNGKREGKGILHFANGTIYDGEWHNDLCHGDGIATMPNGTSYIGEWIDNKRSGKGKLINANGSLIYDGNWFGGRKYGKGKMTYINGDVYEGDWVNDKRHGYGAFTEKNGKKTFGEWENDVFIKEIEQKSNSESESEYHSDSDSDPEYDIRSYSGSSICSESGKESEIKAKHIDPNENISL